MIAETFADGAGNVVVRGVHTPSIRVIGWSHDPRCAEYAIATIELARSTCECPGRPLLGFTADWPMDPPSPPQSIEINPRQEQER